MPDSSHFFVVAYKRSKSATTALTALRFLVEYGQAVDDLGDGIKIEDYAEHVGLSRSQAFRRQAAFRTCFPNDDVLTMWEIVKPALRKSAFRHDGSAAQAVFVGSMTCELS
jgi:hypothetical protein